MPLEFVKNLTITKLCYGANDIRNGCVHKTVETQNLSKSKNPKTQITQTKQRVFLRPESRIKVTNAIHTPWTERMVQPQMDQRIGNLKSGYLYTMVTTLHCQQCAQISLQRGPL